MLRLTRAPLPSLCHLLSTTLAKPLVRIISRKLTGLWIDLDQDLCLLPEFKFEIVTREAAKESSSL